MRLIDADVLRAEMYHEAFETDTDLQKWDSGCWIRYRMFENAVDNAPIVDAVPVVRCKDCKYGIDWDGRLGCEWHGFYQTEPNWFCADGERRES